MAELEFTCVRCGAPLRPGTKFCTSCGMPQPGADDDTAPLAAPVRTAGAAGTPAKKKKTLLWALVALFGVLAAAAVILLIVLRPAKEEKDETERSAPLFRVTYYKSSYDDGDILERKYTYNDAEHSGRAEFYRDGEQTEYALLTLNESGLIACEQHYKMDGEKTYAYAYEYDDRGNRTCTITYEEDGSHYEYRATYNANHIENWSSEIHYDKNGRELWHDELRQIDKTHFLYEQYENGAVNYTLHYELRFDGNTLVEAKATDEDGNLVFTNIWERDKYNNWTSQKRVLPNGSTVVFEQTLERIG